jgi:hypothetical protein
MDGRLVTVLLTMLVPAVLFVLTGLFFSWNPLAILTIFAIVIAGALYLLSYTDTF